MLTLPSPDLLEAFRGRLVRLLGHLKQNLEQDRDLVVVFPQSLDPAEQERWVQQIEAQRKTRPHLSNYWQSSQQITEPPLPWTVGMALDLVEGGYETLAEELKDEVLFCFEHFVEKRYQKAVSARLELVQQWPRPRRETSTPAWALQALTTLLRVLPEGEHPPSNQLVGYTEDQQPVISYYWPGQAAPMAVANWATRKLTQLEIPNDFVNEAKIGFPSDIFLHNLEQRRFYRIPSTGLALTFLAEQQVAEGSRRPAMAIDASKEHHDLMGGMRDWPKDAQRHRGQQLKDLKVQTGPDAIERVELFEQGHAVQLQLPMRSLEGMQDHAIEALRRLRGAKGLRHWAALLRLFSVEGGRSGTYRWLLSEHLAAMGYDERQQRDPVVRAEAAHEVEALASLELAIYTKGGELRERRRLLLETGRFERLVGSEYKLDGIEFQMNQRVFGGVRTSTGEIGAKWMPAPVALATIDHIRYPYAHALGMLLAIRVRWRLDEQADHLNISGERLLQLAGIIFQKSRNKRVWEKLKHSLDVLQEVEQIERYEWQDEPWTLAGICRIYPSAWLLDRAARGVIPEEKPVDPDKPITGKELKIWREKQALSQRDLARRLNLTQQAIAKAEGQSDASLGPKLRAALAEPTTRPVDPGVDSDE